MQKHIAILSALIIMTACPPGMGESMTATDVSSSSSSGTQQTEGLGMTSSSNPTSGSTGISSSTGEETTVDPSTSSGGSTEGASSSGSTGEPAPLCDPTPGDLWGPCDEEFPCSEGFCLGNICVSTCNADPFCETLGCGTPKCEPSGACVLACPCGVPGMVCDPRLDMCVWK